jgi:PAS domain S-box-containing protein
VAGLLGLSWLVSYVLGGAGRVPPHWFYLPILLAAARFGLPGAAATAVVAGLVAGPLLPLDVSTGTQQHLLDWSARLGFFLGIGLVMGAVIVRLKGSLEREIALAREGQDLVLRESEWRIRSIIETANEAVVGMDAGGLITDWNRGAEATFGWSWEEAIGRVLVETVIPERYREAHRKGVEHFLTTGEGPVLNTRLELEALHREGHEFPVELTISVVPVSGSVSFIAFVHDITQRKKAEEVLRESEATLRTVFAASPDIITMVKADGELGPPSPAVRDVLGYEPAEYAQMDRMSLIHPDDRNRVSETLRTLLRGGRPVEFRFRVPHADGRWVVLESHARGMTDAEGRPSGLVAVSRDVTEKVALEEALSSAKKEAERAREDAERANRAKSEFLSRMSHELRTPLNAILGFGQLLEMDGLEPQHQESVEQILKGGKHLLDLINEVLDIARIESGRMTLSLEPVMLADALSEAIGLIQPLASEQGIELKAEDARSADRYVRADRQRLKQVLLNLLSNAVKYNRSGGRVIVRCLEVQGEGLRVEVSDQGAGIPPEMMDRLFVPFERLGAEGTGVEGTGLGLALSKGLTEAMGGSLGMTSIPGQGSTFFVELPRAEGPGVTDEQEEAGGRLGAPAPDGSHTLLYIEDNLANLRLIERALDHRPGLILLSAMQGSLGLDLARQHQPDLILLDLHLPDMSGEEVLRHLQSDPKTRGIPVIVISADATPGQIRNLLVTGARAYLTKPIDVSRFFEAVDQALAERTLDPAG